MWQRRVTVTSFQSLYLEKNAKDQIIQIEGKVTNTPILEKVKEDKNILNTIWQQKHKWLEQVLRNEVLLREIIEGRLSAKCSVEERHYKLMKRCIISKVSRSEKGSRRSRKMQHYKQNRNGTNVLYSRQLEDKEKKEEDHMHHRHLTNRIGF